MYKSVRILIKSYVHVPAKPRTQAGGTIAQSLPMASMFLRNKLLSWSSVFLSIQNYLNTPINNPDADEKQHPPILSVLFSLIALFSCYIGLIFPAGDPSIRAASNAASSASTAAASATGSS